ncbi:hypothetical protein CAEBREN_25287 [Caenorhabditis brenneri]|uniref:Uncharacterized protein n=1 Tax=Caenorhabditis brenneri TaxID=135651 RepID=G0MLM9_CAEBE|nr:hypothetical protein CAEBREN_25287 [Caenorhabditis brenneri]
MRKPPSVPWIFKDNYPFFSLFFIRFSSVPWKFDLTLQKKQNGDLETEDGGGGGTEDKKKERRCQQL